MVTDHYVTPLLAAAPNLDTSFVAKLMFQLTGFVIVFGVLLLLWGVVSFLGLIFSRFGIGFEAVENSTALSKAKPIPQSTKPPLSPQHVAVITAALHTVMKGPYRIVDIKESDEKR